MPRWLSSTAMHAWTEEMLGHLEVGRSELLVVVDAMPVSDHGRCPEARAWSVANVLSHLARTEGQVAALLQKLSLIHI